MKPIKLIGLINLAVGTLTTALFIYTLAIYKRPFPDTDKELKKLILSVQDEAKLKNVYLGRLTINLVAKNSDLKYLELEVYIIPIKNRYLPLIEEHKALITDRFIEIAGHFSSDEIGSITGKLLFEERVKKSVHKDIGQNFIKQIYFTRFIVQ